MNNTEKALEYVNTLDQSKREVRTIKAALLKQISETAEYADFERHGTAFICTECRTLLMGYKSKYCSNCGQKLK